MQGHRDQVAGMDVPGAGDDLEGLGLPHIDLAYPHMVGIGVALHGPDLAHHHVGNFRAQVVGQLHLGARQGHGLGKVFVIGLNGDELVEPFAR